MAPDEESAAISGTITGEMKPLQVLVVGPCASGKSTLVVGLRRAGLQAKAAAQEHSYVPAMYLRFNQPKALVYLDADLGAIQTRRPDASFGERELAEERRRLAHARAHCDIYLDTSRLSAAEVQAQVLAFLMGVTKDG